MQKEWRFLIFFYLIRNKGKMSKNIKNTTRFFTGFQISGLISGQGKKSVGVFMKCNYDCFNCIYDDCINDRIRKVDKSEINQIDCDFRRERYFNYLLNLKRDVHSSSKCHVWYYKKRDKYINRQLNRYYNNRTDLIAYQLERYYSHQDELKEYQRSYYYKNRERILERLSEKRKMQKLQNSI